MKRTIAQITRRRNALLEHELRSHGIDATTLAADRGIPAPVDSLTVDRSSDGSLIVTIRGAEDDLRELLNAAARLVESV